MKKFLCMVLVTISITALIGCGSNNKTTDKQIESKTESSQKEEKKEEINTIKIGDTITGKSSNIVVNKIEFSYDVLPDKTSGAYTHYPAKEGKVYINIDVDVKNTQKQELPCDKVMTVEADYNNGYKYKSQPIVENSTTGFTYANITSITPLETMGMRFLIDCPKEVAESNNSLVLTFNLDGTKYQYKMR
ncbi:hypothetical protein [Clostridium saccharoperbutylacetonicum]|uniref:hypothetical protein n=1 Tax=Clostridium saccharoperbutylacetonicum TaxID=36745 RepID=UPI0009838FE6|nr:hypothetical protein [Clostridium saccharoperbutylacetonicum]AQR96208.1 hypothetical protein CLSAP_35290 [Clostridium saccharoperbutylacetonicum]NSB32081.1 hypothetical protein [Clostridium saccharoperbutylacetonicum]